MMPRVRDLSAWAITLVVVVSGAKGCSAREGCLSGDDGLCIPRAACEKLAFPTCSNRSIAISRIASAAERAPGVDALAARGDVLLTSSRVRLVLDALDAPHFLAPTGGNVVDFSPPDRDDGLNVAFTGVGILPRDAVAYRSIVLDDHAPEYVAAILRGALDGRPEITVVTRYELRPCEPGVRVRTELFHGGREPESFFLCDALYWGGREAASFTPITGRGFVHPELELDELGDAFEREPFVAAHPMSASEPAYALVPCDRGELESFHSDTVTASGVPRTLLLPGDGIAYERFFVVASTFGGAADAAFAARASMFGEASVVVRGRVVNERSAFGDQRSAMLLFYEPAPGANPDDPHGRRPWSSVVPAADGSFAVRLPANRSFRTEVSVLGRPIGRHGEFATGIGDATIADLVVPASGVLDVTVVDEVGRPVLAEIVLTPVEPADPQATRGSTFGAFDVEKCTPWLGPPHGGSPACNRALTEQTGATSFAVPSGSYWVYATRGPFASIARTRIDVKEGERARTSLTVSKIPGLVPDGVLGADFHVHGGASFDSSMPDRDRARTFVAQGIDVIAATDHDVVTTYGRVLRATGLEGELVVLPGVETTGHILFYEPPGRGFIPRVVGHYNFWPLPFDEDLPRNGAPWDERLEPGALFDRVAALSRERGVVQMNHPFASTTFGRDEGFLTAIGFDPRHIVGISPPEDTPEGQLRKRSPGGRSALDFDAQEVMNGTSTRQFHDYRIAWYGFLAQGILRAGTANSDSHSLAIEVLGMPRNLVFGGHTIASFDRVHFDEDVRRGRMVGTNGPVVLATIDGRGPSLDAFTPSASAELAIEVRAAPWIPVEEIRIVVNGAIARTITQGIARPADPFGSGGTLRYRGSIPLREIASGGDDDFIVVEAGLPLWPAADLDDDGLPETTDNDHNGVVDRADQAGLDEDYYYKEPPRPRESDARFHAYVVAPGHWSTAFTNPWLIDRKGDGWTAPRR